MYKLDLILKFYDSTRSVICLSLKSDCADITSLIHGRGFKLRYIHYSVTYLQWLSALWSAVTDILMMQYMHKQPRYIRFVNCRRHSFCVYCSLLLLVSVSFVLSLSNMNTTVYLRTLNDEYSSTRHHLLRITLETHCAILSPRVWNWSALVIRVYVDRSIGTRSVRAREAFVYIDLLRNIVNLCPAVSLRNLDHSIYFII